MLLLFFQHLVAPFVKQMMVYGYRSPITGKYNRVTSISSSAYITDKGKIDTGDNLWVNHDVRIDASGGVKIGDGC